MESECMADEGAIGTLTNAVLKDMGYDFEHGSISYSKLGEFVVRFEGMSPVSEEYRSIVLDKLSVISLNADRHNKRLASKLLEDYHEFGNFRNSDPYKRHIGEERRRTEAPSGCGYSPTCSWITRNSSIESITRNMDVKDVDEVMRVLNGVIEYEDNDTVIDTVKKQLERVKKIVEFSREMKSC